MKLILVISALLFLGACSRGEGVYRGVATDVSWEGWFVTSCEVILKTSDQSSHREFISGTDKGQCSALQETLGKPIVVKYKHKFPSLFTDSNYLIQEIKYE